MISVMNSKEIDLDRNPSAVDDNKNDIVLSEEIRGFNGDDMLGNKASDSYEIRVSKDGNVAEVESLKEIDEKFSDGNGGSERNELKTSVRKGKSEKSVSKSKKRSGKREKGDKAEKGSSKSQYNSMLLKFDEFAVNGGGGSEDGVVGHGYEVGDMVWGKVKSHPWWPGHVYSEEFASQSVRRSKTEDNVLVAFFGDSSYGWFDPVELVPFDSSFVEKSQQTSSRTFLKAVEEAVDEANRRHALGLACRCRDESNFSEEVPGYFSVNIPNYESKTVYLEDLIRKSRDTFQPREMLDFVKKLALSPTSNEHVSIHFMNNKATVVAYRTAVYDEFDETYAQAFGHQPVRTSKQTQGVASTRAPLSGPLVIAEALGKAKGAARPHKSKDHTKKDRYLFKRRDEPNELKPSGEIHQDQDIPSGQQVYVHGSLPIASHDYILQNSSPSVSSNYDFTEKLERTESVTGDSVSDLGHQVTGKEGMTIHKKPVVVEFSMDGAPGQLIHPLDARSSLVKGEKDIPCTVDVSRVATDLDDHASSMISKPAENFVQSQATEIKVAGEPSQDAGVTAAPLLGTDEAKVHVEVPNVHVGNATKKTKIRKREVADLENENSMLLAKKKNKRKVLVSSKDMQTNRSAGKAKAKVRDIPGNSVRVPVAAEEDVQVDHMKKGGTVGTSSFPGSVVAHKMAQMKELDLPQLLHDLQVLALDPFYNVDRGTSTVTQEVFLRFRSLVYQKSLPSLPPSDSESNESRAKPQAVVTANNLAAENVVEPSFKRQKTVVKSDDPTKGGQKHGPSDRQEDIAAKKKINDMKVLTTDKKAALKTSALLRADVKEMSGPTTKSVKHTPLKRPGPTSRAPEPTMLVMKFPPQGTLPSPMELKARFARFGQMDHSATRIFWKTSTCRIVYRYKADAESALRFASGNSSLFGNTGVRCFIKEAEVSAPEPEPVKLRREESSMGTLQSRPVVVRRMTPAPLKSQVLQQQAGVQLKSILKKSTGDEASGNGGGKGNPRVKFLLGGSENSRGGEELMIGGNKNFNNNASFADGGISSTSTSHHGMDFNSKNVVVPPSMLPLLPLPPTSAVQFPRLQNNFHYTESEAPRIAHNLNVPTAPPTTHSSNSDADISQQMMALLTKCNDVVRNLTSYLGYVPYRPL